MTIPHLIGRMRLTGIAGLERVAAPTQCVRVNTLSGVDVFFRMERSSQLKTEENGELHEN